MEAGPGEIDAVPARLCIIQVLPLVRESKKITDRARLPDSRCDER